MMDGQAAVILKFTQCILQRPGQGSLILLKGFNLQGCQLMRKHCSPESLVYFMPLYDLTIH